MLTIIVPAVKMAWDEKLDKFVSVPETTLHLEHSLISISKWEMKYHKVYLNKKVKTNEETLDYIKFMTINKVDDYIYNFLTDENITVINEYIKDPMTALHFPDVSPKGGPFTGSMNREVLSNELLYYLMISYNIPIEFQKWHLNRLLALLRVFENKNTSKTKGKVSRQTLAAKYAQMNAERRAKYKTKG